MGEKHSAVGYLFREGAFLPAQETKPVRNEFGLDLFQHRGSVYEGKTGLQFCSLQQAEDLAGFVEKHGGTDEEMLHTIIGAQILGGTMDYRGFSNMKGFEQFRAACRAGDVQYSNLDYGFVEQTENLMLPDCAKEPQFEKAYRLLNLSDHEFNAIRNGSLESLGEDRTRLILDKALSWAAQNYAGWDLYRHLRDELGMSNEEIGKAGFDLDEFYEIEAADSAEYEVEADYGEEL